MKFNIKFDKMLMDNQIKVILRSIPKDKDWGMELPKEIEKSIKATITSATKKDVEAHNGGNFNKAVLKMRLRISQKVKAEIGDTIVYNDEQYEVRGDNVCSSRYSDFYSYILVSKLVSTL